MVSERALRPRTLSAVFGVYFLLMAIVAWFSAQALGYRYTVDTTRFTFMVFLIAGAIFLVGVAIAAVLSARSLDARIEELESSAEPAEVVEEIEVDESVADEVPPPLEEAPAGDHVDRDIDELLVSLQEMEQDAGAADEVAEPEAPVTVARHGSRVTELAPTIGVADAGRLLMLRRKRDGLAGYFAGPALAAIGVVGISAAMLPGSDAFLQTYFELNTALLLGLAYTFVGIAAYVAASILLVLRNR